MNDVTRILSAIEQGDPKAAGDLLPMVYQELRRLAARKLAREAPGQTLQPTALVHEAYLRLVGAQDPGWSGRGHFFAAAAEAMRRILVERARRRKRIRHGGGGRPLSLEGVDLASEVPPEGLLVLDEALERFAREDPLAARLVELRYFAGLTMHEAAEALGLPLRTAERNWTYARTWLHREVAEKDTPSPA
ncbi:MAG: ECF-type sigma factor [Isosphaerales bacterium]